jgi:diketogulonate reductase-like aldo/keto reductase
MSKTSVPLLGTSRRTFLGATAAAGALGASASALSGTLGTTEAQARRHSGPAGRAATPGGAVTTREIPLGKEVIPALGLGTFLVFDALPGDKRDNLREVMKVYFEGGARVVDTSPLYGSAIYTVGHHAAALGITEELFLANKVWATGEYLADESHARRSLEQSQRVLWRQKMDAMHVHSLVNVDVVLPYLRAWKKEGLIRYTAISHYENPYHEAVADLVEGGNLDMVQINYSIFNRSAERRVLPAARDKGVAVLTNMPFEKARLFQVVRGQPVPDFARDFARTWPEFFLKWVMAHPAVTCVLAATSNPQHAAENVAALRGPLPDEAMRQRMVRHMEDLAGFDRIASVAWYPGKEQVYQGLIRRAQGLLRQRLS